MAYDPCLCIVFNHPFPENIPLLERIYRKRFKKLKFIIPFYRDVDNDDVITVYRGSYHHQGFATDAWHKLKGISCSHFIFLQDDVFLNPLLHSDNVLEHLGVGAKDGFINQIGSLRFDAGSWHWILGIVWKYFYPRNMLSGSGVDSLETLFRYFPPIEEANRIMEHYGVGKPAVWCNQDSLREGSIVLDIPYFATRDRTLVRGLNRIIVASLFDTAAEKRLIEFPYPLALSAWGADFFVVPKDNFDTYQHYCGILAAACIFAEVSVPTALILACDNVVTAANRPGAFEWIWTPDRNDLGGQLIERLSDPNLIAVHPVKLSLMRHDRSIIDRLFPGN
jgi:hypothetical protein